MASVIIPVSRRLLPLGAGGGDRFLCQCGLDDGVASYVRDGVGVPALASVSAWCAYEAQLGSIFVVSCCT